MQRPLTILVSGVGIAGPALTYWLVRRGHRPVLIERMPELRVGGHAVDIRGTALAVIERMGLEAAVREARTQILTLSAVRPDGRRTYDVVRTTSPRQRICRRHLLCGKPTFGPTWRGIRDWPPMGCRRSCRLRESAYSRAISR
jgi:2-polyprenyl-6-methoxyphenol hydroxylase-like FAD-dependent oxidoreductase